MIKSILVKRQTRPLFYYVRLRQTFARLEDGQTDPWLRACTPDKARFFAVIPFS